MTNADLKPLPDVTNPATQAFWLAANEGRLVCQRCTRCFALRWTPRAVCPECLGFDSGWVDVRPTGSLYSWTTYHRAFDRRFADDIPYSVALIQLDDGPRMIGRLLGDPETFAADVPVRAVFQQVAADITLVQWALATSTERSVEFINGHVDPDRTGL